MTKLSAEDANSLCMLIDDLSINPWKFADLRYHVESSELLERVQSHIAALSAERDNALSVCSIVQDERDSLRAELAALKDRCKKAEAFCEAMIGMNEFDTFDRDDLALLEGWRLAWGKGEG